MKKFIIALMLSAAILIPQAKAAQECHTINELMSAVHEKTDVHLIQAEIMGKSAIVFLKNLNETFGTDVSGVAHVHVIHSDPNTDGSIFIILSDKDGCIKDGGPMDRNTFRLMMEP